MSEEKSTQILRLEVARLIRESAIFCGFTTSFCCGQVELNISKSAIFRNIEENELSVYIEHDEHYIAFVNGCPHYSPTLDGLFRLILREILSYTYKKSESLRTVHRTINALIDIDFPETKSQGYSFAERRIR